MNPILQLIVLFALFVVVGIVGAAKASAYIGRWVVRGHQMSDQLILGFLSFVCMNAVFWACWDYVGNADVVNNNLAALTMVVLLPAIPCGNIGLLVGFFSRKARDGVR